MKKNNCIKCGIEIPDIVPFNQRISRLDYCEKCDETPDGWWVLDPDSGVFLVKHPNGQTLEGAREKFRNALNGENLVVRPFRCDFMD